MIVTAGTLDVQPEESANRHPQRVIQGVLLSQESLVAVCRQPQERRRDLRSRIEVGQLIPGQLLDGELVERDIVVEGLDHVVAIPPGKRNLGIRFVSDGLPIAGNIKPMARPAFAVLRTRQQVIDNVFECLGRVVSQEGRLLLGSGRQSNQIEVNPAKPHASIRFRGGVHAGLFHLREDKRIDRSPNPGAVPDRRRHRL